MSTRLVIEVTCDHVGGCDRKTRASGKLCVFNLVQPFVGNIEFPTSPHGTPSEWLAFGLEKSRVLCPTHRESP